MAIKTFLTDEEIQQMIDQTEYPRDKAALSFLADGGCRVSELLGLLVDHVDFDTGEVLIQHLKRGIKKKCPKCTFSAGRSQRFCAKCGQDLSGVQAEGIEERTRLISVGNRTLTLLHQHMEGLNQGDKVFNISRQWVYYIVRHAAERIGLKGQIILNPETGKKHFVHPHNFRDCVVPETRIFSESGILPARDIFFNFKTRVCGSDNKLYDVTDKFTKILKEVFTVKAGNRELQCSGNHYLFRLTTDGLSPVKVIDLKPGDYIAGIKEVHLDLPIRYGDNIARFMGYCIGDGHVNLGNRSVNIYDQKKNFIEYYLSLLPYKGIIKSTNANCWRGEINSIELCRFLKDIAIKSKFRRVPLGIMTASNSEIAEFIAGYYDAEGWDFCFSSSSKELIVDIQNLLLRLGIESHWYKHPMRGIPPGAKKRVCSTFYDLYCCNQLDFARLIPTLKNVSHASPGNLPKYPVQPFIEMLMDAPIKYRAGFHFIGRFLKNPVEPVNLEKITMAFEALASDSPEYIPQLQILKSLPDLNITWLKVEEIKNRKYLGIPAYDFTVDRIEYYIANGFITHNSLAVSWLSFAGADGNKQKALQDYLGHLSFNTTMRYNKLTPGVVKKVANEVRKFREKKEPNR